MREPGRPRPGPAAIAALLVVFGGCADAPRPTVERQPVAGTVTVNGQPMAAGSVWFHPDGSEAQPTAVAVKDGKFALDRPLGLAAGHYKVALSSRELPRALDPGQPPGPPPKRTSERIPPEYNAKSRLEAVVTPNGANSFDFTIPVTAAQSPKSKS